jgi:hypothetical protein
MDARDSDAAPHECAALEVAMRPRHPASRAVLLATSALVVLWVSASPVRAQSAATAALSGTVVDASEAAVPGASLTLTAVATGARFTAATDASGRFRVASLPPAQYELGVARGGFTPLVVRGLVLQVGEERTLRLRMTVGQLSEEVIVEGALGYRDAGSVATGIDREIVDRQPLNGRSFQTLLELSPGVVIVPTNVTTGGTFSVNGQRSGTNQFTIDGVSANFGVEAAATLYQTAGGGLPSYSAQGGTNVLASVDAVQEFTIQTSSYAPEFGRQPGAQVSIVTRSGSNVLHGSAFEYFRDDSLDANDFFANKSELGKPELSQHDFGFTLGGPLVKDRTFFFASYEGLRLERPVTSPTFVVPSVEARQQGSPDAQAILQAFPLPNGPVLPDDPLSATYVATFSVPSSLDAFSLRLDHGVSSRLRVFARYNYGPSDINERAYFATPNITSFREYASESLTLGVTYTGSRFVNDLRVGLARSRAGDRYELDDFGGAVVPPDDVLLPPYASSSDSLGVIYIGADSGLYIGLNSKNRQRQLHLVDTLSVLAGSHALKLGVDARWLFPVNDGSVTFRAYFFDTTADVLNETIPFLYMGSADQILEPRYSNFGVFLQDVWRVTPRLTLTYGLRYDVNPAPGEANGHLPLTVRDVDAPAGPELAPAGTRYFGTSHSDLAPRVGFSYDLSGSGKLVLRGGAGVFYDLPHAFAGSAFYTGSYPYGNTIIDFGVPLSAPVTTDPIPPVVVAPPYGQMVAYVDGYRSPRTYQWNVGIEKTLASGAVTATYVGAAGRRLGRVESLRGTYPDFDRIDLVRNTGRSDYHALQLHYRRRPVRGLGVLASYTLASARDNVTEESIINFQAPGSSYDAELDRGPSDYDVRHALTAALSYDVPGPGDGWMRALFAGWSVDGILRVRSALPVNVLTGEDPLGLGYTYVGRPDRVESEPLYIDDPDAPGGRRINASAFSVPDQRQGDLDRNSLRGFGAWQVDASLRRELALSGRLRAQLRVDVFNVFNHPNFFNPESTMTHPSFGEPTQMLARGLRGLDPLYQIGGPRSVQLSLRVLF